MLGEGGMQVRNLFKATADPCRDGLASALASIVQATIPTAEPHRCAKLRHERVFLFEQSFCTLDLPASVRIFELFLELSETLAVRSACFAIEHGLGRGLVLGRPVRTGPQDAHVNLLSRPSQQHGQISETARMR